MQPLAQKQLVVLLKLPKLSHAANKKVVAMNSQQNKKKTVRRAVTSVDAPAPFFVTDSSTSVNQYVANAAHGPPKFEPYTLGFSSAPPIRGSLILQV